MNRDCLINIYNYCSISTKLKFGMINHEMYIISANTRKNYKIMNKSLIHYQPKLHKVLIGYKIIIFVSAIIVFISLYILS